ncbi:MAG TPA: hypothetical protein VNX01_03940 [Bacteroidia bacterium]|jgi:hypothetical protein|nr:hypothetical protein [Bacteroidia bacterium]
MKRPILLFLTILGFNSIIGQINNTGNPNTAPNSGVQTPPSGAQTIGPDFQPATLYISTVPPVATIPDTQLIPSTPSVTPQTQPNTTTPNSSGTNNSLYVNPTNPGSPSSPPKQ